MSNGWAMHDRPILGEEMVKPSGSEEERGFQALLEKVEGDVKAFGEQVTSLTEKIDRVADELNGRLAALDQKVDLHTRTILSRLDSHERTHRV